VEGDVAFEQLPALAAVQVDDLDAVLAEPVETSGKGSALADNQRADAKLTDQAAAIPAWGERGDHDQVAIAALAARQAKGVGLRVNAGVALLYTAIVATAY